MERRRAAENAAKAQQRAARQAERERQGEERQRNRTVASAIFMVAGVRYEGRAAVIARYARAGQVVFLVRDRANTHSRNAIEVRLKNGMQIGYVPEEDAGRLAPHLDTGCRHAAEITIILDKGRAPIPVVDARVYGNAATIPGAVTEDEVLGNARPALPVNSAAFVATVRGAITENDGPENVRPAPNHALGWALALSAVLVALLILILELRG